MVPFLVLLLCLRALSDILIISMGNRELAALRFVVWLRMYYSHNFVTRSLGGIERLCSGKGYTRKCLV